MGLAIPALRFLAREHKRSPFAGPVLTFGRQMVYATVAQSRRILREEGIEPQALLSGQSFPAADAAFFWMLGGLDVESLDVSGYEGAEHIADLNQPIPYCLAGRFGMVLDGGTIEHIFGVRQALDNVVWLLKPGGRVIHMSPMSNYAQHGYYQFSPAMFYDYYGCNGFDDLRCYIVEQPTWDNISTEWGIWEWDTMRPNVVPLSSQHLMVWFSARKTEQSNGDLVPLQGWYRTCGLKVQKPPLTPAESWLVRRLKNLAKRVLPWRWVVGINRILKRDLSVKPWGLKYLGKLSQ